VYNFLGSIVDDPPSLLFATMAGRPYRVRLCDGAVVWKGDGLANGQVAGFSTGGMALGPNGVAYVTSNTEGGNALAGVLSAYNTSSGARLWTQRLELPASSAPSVGRLGGASGRVSVVVGLGQNPGMPDASTALSGWTSAVVAFDAETGVPTGWRYDPPPHRKLLAEGDSLLSADHVCLPDAWTNAAIDADGTVYIGHMSGNLFALRDKDGDGSLEEAAGEVRNYYGGRAYQGSPGIADGMLTATPCDGLHVFLQAPAAP